jgi:peptidoglycan/xylan/chitin deacetylase (PgdA/CDA1 family)
VPVLHLTSLADKIAGGVLPRRCAAVTFDDGYADNLHAATPILERHEVPATVFVTTGAGGRTEEFYWDECARLVLSAPSSDRRLRIAAADHAHEWTLADVNPATRRRTCLELCDVIRDLPRDDRRTAMRQVREWAGVPDAPGVRDTHRTLTDDEIFRLCSGGLVQVGAHTENHPALTSLPAEAQTDEIARNKAKLEAVVGRGVTSFAYPYGLHSNVSVEAVKQAGFRLACTTEEHAARRASEVLRLPRFDMGDCDGDAFERKLRWAFGR